MTFAKFLVITSTVPYMNAYFSIQKYTASRPWTQDFSVTVVVENGGRCGLLTRDDVLFWQAE